MTLWQPKTFFKFYILTNKFTWFIVFQIALLFYYEPQWFQVKLQKTLKLLANLPRHLLTLLLTSLLLLNFLTCVCLCMVHLYFCLSLDKQKSTIIAFFFISRDAAKQKNRHWRMGLHTYVRRCLMTMGSGRFQSPTG